MTQGLSVMNGETVSESCVAGFKAYCMDGSEYCMHICIVQILVIIRLSCMVLKSAPLLHLCKILVGYPTSSLCSCSKLKQI